MVRDRWGVLAAWRRRAAVQKQQRERRARGRNLLIQDVVEEHVLVVGVLVLLREHGLGVQELLPGAAVGALGARGWAALARTLAHGSRSISRTRCPFSKRRSTRGGGEGAKEGRGDLDAAATLSGLSCAKCAGSRRRLDAPRKVACVPVGHPPSLGRADRSFPIVLRAGDRHSLVVHDKHSRAVAERTRNRIHGWDPQIGS